jgi:hypothetical protein
LIAQLRNRIFEKRLALLSEKIKEFDKAKEEITADESLEEFQHFRAKAVRIQTLKGFPGYLASGVKFVLATYIITALFSLFWLLDVEQNPPAEAALILLFCLSTVGFFSVVWTAITDIHELMKEEFEQLKKEAASMGALTFTFMKAEPYNIIFVSFSGTSNQTSNSIVIRFQNTGTAPFTITTSTKVNGVSKPLAAEVTIAAGSTQDVTIPNVRWINGRTYNIELVTAQGTKMTYIANAPQT